MAIADNQQDEQPRAVIMSKVMSPDMANFSGNVHGGHLMQFLAWFKIGLFLPTAGRRHRTTCVVS
ncbi:MAG: hypothetical protein GY782_03940 [Gammaproteobacteria bacterium]|nr:hypothetical protein [Gammaproteobacteria bacterium]